jgi:hypothetical protein
MEVIVGAAILVHNSSAVTQCKNRSNGHNTFADQSNLYVWTHACDQVSEPRAGLREHMMASPSRHEQPVEVIEKSLGTAFFIRKLLPFGSPYAALEAAFV